MHFLLLVLLCRLSARSLGIYREEYVVVRMNNWSDMITSLIDGDTA